MTLSRADTSRLQALGWAPPERFVAKADDGKTDLHGLIYKPADFDPSKKYPVLDYIYNGPQTTWVERTYLGPTGTLPMAMSQLGFVVLTVDGRGTPGRGKSFQDVVYGRFGQHEVADHVATLKSLAASRPFLDLSRVGVFGGSFGGYMTIRACSRLQASSVSASPSRQLPTWRTLDPRSRSTWDCQATVPKLTPPPRVGDSPRSFGASS